MGITTGSRWPDSSESEEVDFRWSAQEKAFHQQVERFFEQEVVFPPGWRPYLQTELGREEATFVRRLARELGRRGWLTLSWPKEYGGQEAPLLAAILTEAAYYYGVMYARDFGVAMLAPILMKFGTEEQKRRFLPPIARGEIWWCMGYTEPNAGSDVASLRTRAEERDDHFLVNGQKTFTSNAHNTDWLYFLARTDLDAPKHRGISFLLADMKSPGLTVRPLLSLTGAHEVNEVFFEDVRVPKENLVGEKNRGFYVAMALLEFERFFSDVSCGSARRVLERLVGYTREKGVRPELRLRLAELTMELEVAHWFYYRNAWLQGKGIPFEVGPPMNKLFVTELNQRVYGLGVELLGLYGQLRGNSPHAPLEGELAFLFSSAGQDTIGGGTSEIQRNLIATRGLGLPRG